MLGLMTPLIRCLVLLLAVLSLALVGCKKKPQAAAKDTSSELPPEQASWVQPDGSVVTIPIPGSPKKEAPLPPAEPSPTGARP